VSSGLLGTQEALNNQGDFPLESTNRLASRLMSVGYESLWIMGEVHDANPGRFVFQVGPCFSFLSVEY